MLLDHLLLVKVHFFTFFFELRIRCTFFNAVQPVKDLKRGNFTRLLVQRARMGLSETVFAVMLTCVLGVSLFSRRVSGFSSLSRLPVSSLLSSSRCSSPPLPSPLLVNSPLVKVPTFNSLSSQCFLLICPQVAAHLMM